MDQQEITVTQFGSNAKQYLASPVHANGADLDRVADIVRQHAAVRALDLGCGAGHVAYALARGGAGRVVAYDPSAEMLRVVAEEALSRGYPGIETLARLRTCRLRADRSILSSPAIPHTIGRTCRGRLQNALASWREMAA